MVDLSTETVTEYLWIDEQRELCLGGKLTDGDTVALKSPVSGR